MRNLVGICEMKEILVNMNFKINSNQILSIYKVINSNNTTLGLL